MSLGYTVPQNAYRFNNGVVSELTDADRAEIESWFDMVDNSSVVMVLPSGHTTTIDSIDADLGSLRWHETGRGLNKYVTHSRRDKDKGTVEYLYLHRIILERMIGRALEKHERVDHKDSNTLNNRRSNLRIATASENSRNRRLSRTNTSGYKGATYNKHVNKWQAHITVNRKCIYLGLFESPEEAHAAYCKAAKKYFGEFAREV